MKKTIKTSAIGLAAVALMTATSVQAQQWSSFWDFTSTSPIDTMTATITGSTFTDPGYQAEFFNNVGGLSPLPGWTSTDNVGNTFTTMSSGTALAPGTDLVYWDNVSTAMNVPFTVDQKSYYAGTLEDEVIISYDGSGVPGGPFPGQDRIWNNAGFSVLEVPVPAPDGGMTIALLGGALLGLQALRRKLFC